MQYRKTCIMFIGPRDPAEAPLIEAMGFSIVKKIKILGVWVDSEGRNLNHNFKLALDKIRGQINLWSQFNLSMIGRIAISKTYLISQITYIGAILTPDADQLEEIQQLINNFVLRNMPLAKDRLYRAPGYGGLGLINISNMLDALKCSWFKRIFLDGVTDNWRLNLMIRSFFSVSCFRLDQLDEQARPLEYNIGKSFWLFLQAFWKKNHNFLKAPLIDNPCISWSMLDNRRVDNKCVDHTVIGRYSYDLHKETWLNLKVCDMLTNGIIISMLELTVRLGFNITVNTYLALRRATSHALVKYGNNNGSEIARPLVEKKVKNFISNFSLICKVRVPQGEEPFFPLSQWTKSYLPVPVRMFAYQLVNNTLPVGARLGNRYLNDVNRAIDTNCPFCTSAGYI